MSKSETEKFTVRIRPDYIPADQEYLYPAIGGVYHDFVPDGETALTMHGNTPDYLPEVKPAEEKESA